MHLVGVYNANGGFLGELSYIRGKMTNKTRCALCDITHGANPFGKKDWKRAQTCLAVPFTFVHLNQMDDQTRTLMETTTAPAILLFPDKGPGKVLVTTQDLEACDKDPHKLVELITDRLSKD